MAVELTPKERPEAFELLQNLRALAKSLRKFLDTEDFGHFEEALRTHQTIKASKVYEHLSGHLDLDNNISQLKIIYDSTGGKIDDIAFGRMLDQVVYTIVRANIMATGLEFKLKRMRKG
ncbi:MAG: hypothetical protein NZ956_03095 [Candidatus Caldarchaeum sp.]|nr:hypothetical protein [Candidatus Caldarchaeum sp.]